MKKHALILLTVVYMLSTVGIAVSQFYCCNKLTSVSLSFNSKDQSNCKNDTHNDGCCKTTHQYLKIKDSHFASNDISLAEKYFSILHTAFPEFELIAPKIQQAVVSNNINAPPLLSSNPIYIFNCTYRI